MTDKLNISLRPLKSTGQTLLDVLRNVIVQIFLLSICIELNLHYITLLTSLDITLFITLLYLLD